jgi:VCBS repeat-containing protein
VSTANFGGAFGFANADFGADGAGTISWNYVLSLFGPDGTDSQLDSNGQSIFLFNDGGVIKGSTAADLADVDASNTIFTIAVDAADGTVTLTQFAEIDHADDGATSNFDSQLATLANGLVRLTGTVTIEDRDGDQDVASQTIDLGGNVRFADDGPTISAGMGGASALLDETGGFDSVTSIAPVIAATFDFGADGAASSGGVTYSIELTAGGNSAPSGLATAVGDFPITLVQTSATTIVGRFDNGSGDQDAFTIVINNDGTLTVTQLVALEHLVDGESAADHDDALTLTGLVTARITVEDGDGDTATTTTEIGDQISFRDDGPMADADSNMVTEGAVVNGNVLTDNADVFGADGADATTPAGGVVGVRAAGGDTTTPVTTGTGTVISTVYGDLTLNADGSYTYDAKPNTTSIAVEDIFVYTIRDADGDTSTTTLTITIDPVTLVADNQTKTVNEAGLDLNQDGDDVAAGTVTGSDPAATTETVTGTLNVTGAGGIAYTPQDVEDALGRFVLNSDGTYTYTLKSAFDGATLDNGVTTDPAVRTFNYSATDANGNSVTGTVTIDIVDDVPTARADSDSVSEDGPLVADGNVLTGAGGGDANMTDGVADTRGADGASVTGVVTGTSLTPVSGNVGSPLVGSYGSLTLAAGGGYSYTLDNANPAVQALGATETLTETFTYTITDGDGDTSTTTLTITINGSNDAPTVGSATTAVSDEGLAGGLPDTAGSPDTTNLAIRTGTIPVNDVDGDALTVSLGIPATSLASGGQPIVWDNSDPHLLLGKVGTVTIISVAIDNDGDFTVTLHGPIDHPDTAIEDALDLVVPVSVFDGIATVTNPTALTIGLEDDSPIAVAPVGTSLVNVAGASILGSLDTDGDVDNNFGGDGGKVIFTSATIAALEAQDLTSGLDPLSYSISADGQVLTAEKSNGDDVFIITLQPAGSPDQYRVEIIRPIDAVQDVDFNDGGYNFVGGNGSWAGFTQPGDNDSQDLLLTPMTNGVDGGTVNTNANEGGISGGNSVGANEAMRVDFVIDLTGSPASGQDYGVLANQNHAFDAHYTANGASALFTAINPGTSSVRIVARDDLDSDNDIGDGVKDTITGVAISYNGATTQVTLAGTYNVGGVNFTVAFSGGEATVSGVVSNTRIAAFTADGYNSIEFHYAGGANFKIGDFGASLIVDEPVPFSVPVAVIDGDGDTSALANIDVVAQPASPPVVLDLDGDGVEYLAAASGVTFDYAGDGTAVATAWVAADDGLLAFDANGNGRVDNGTEIVFGGNGLTDLQGIAARFDSNGDGVLDRNDADFARFGVWQDANSNGVADDGEFRTLDQAGIVAIDLVSDGEAHTTANGSVHVFGESSYALADGTIRTVADAAFARTGSVRAQDRPVTAMPLADALVAASLITMAQGAQASELAPARVMAEESHPPATVREGVALVDVAETVAGSGARELAADAMSAGRVVDTAPHHLDEAFQAVASIADARDSGWRGEDMVARDGGSSDALFDAPSATAGAASAMDSLLMLGLAAAEAATTQAAMAAAQDSAATAVLAEVLDDGRLDLLIDAIAGGEASHRAAGDAPTIDLARFLDAPVANDMAVFVHPAAEVEMQQLASA